MTRWFSWPYTILCFLTALFLYILFLMYHHLCRIERIGTRHHDAVIEGLWHENLILYFISHRPTKGQKIIWLQHPAWYMKSIHILLRLLGIKIALGSSGHNGHRGLTKVITHLNSGYSTMINPDGPAGPIQQLKNGIIRMSQDSQRPIQIVTFHSSYAVRLPTWDRKILPLPGSTLQVKYHPVLYPEDHSFEELRTELLSVLNSHHKDEPID